VEPEAGPSSRNSEPKGKRAKEDPLTLRNKLKKLIMMKKQQKNKSTTGVLKNQDGVGQFGLCL
jgi:hypothetical protein